MIGQMELCQQDGVSFLRFPAFSQLGFVKDAFSTRLGGVSEGEYASMNLAFGRGDDPERVRENYRRFSRAVGFDEKSADIRIAQYESNTRTPKEELLRKIAEVLDVNYRSLYEPTLYAAEDIMYTLFELDEHYPGTRIYEVTDTTDPDFPEKHMAVSFRYRLLDEFLQEWQLRKKQLSSGEITKEEYQEWKLNWPQTADDCGKHEPHKKWRKE